MWNEKTNVVLYVGVVRYINDSFGPAMCSLSWDSGGDLAEVTGPAGPLLRAGRPINDGSGSIGNMQTAFDAEISAILESLP